MPNSRPGIVAFSYGKRAERNEPNPCNTLLGDATVSAIDMTKLDYDHEPVVVVQWEISKRIYQSFSDNVWYRVYVHHAVTKKNATAKSDGRVYLDTADVWRVAKEIFEKAGVKEVVVIANPFLHLGAIKKMVRADGFTVIDWPMPTIGFDNDPRQLQWWCKGRLRFIAYGIFVKLTRLNGIGEKPEPDP